METMMTWPSQTRNKVEDSQVMTPLKKYAEAEDGDESVKMFAQKVGVLVYPPVSNSFLTGTAAP
jgi:hypothetical protein